MRRCLDCDRPMHPKHHRARGVPRHVGRGLCRTCYKAAQVSGSLVDFERLTFSADELLDEWVLLRGEGYTVRQAAPRIGVSFAALDRALYRAVARGDDRGRRRALVAA